MDAVMRYDQKNISFFNESKPAKLSILYRLQLNFI